MAVQAAFPVVDADTHVVEPASIWTDYLDKDYRVLARSAFWREEGEVDTFTIVNGKQIREATQSRIPREAIWKPGVTREAIGQLDPSKPHPINPGAQDPKARLADMDAMGVDQAVLFPTYFAEYFPLVENPDVAAALARAYNDWIADFAAADPKRLIPTAVLPMQNINFALAELRRVAGLGFKAAAIRPLLFDGRFLNHPYYDPLWQEITELGIVAAMHPAVGSANPEWVSHGPFVERVSAPLGIGHPAANGIARMMDNSMLILHFLSHAHLTRFEGIKLLLSHSKGSWLPLVLEKSEGYLNIMASMTTIPVRLDSDKVFFEKGAMIGFDADEVGVQRHQDLFEDAGIWGSHYPNQDTTTPEEAIDQLRKGGVSDSIIKKMLSENAAKTFGLAVTA